MYIIVLYRIISLSKKFVKFVILLSSSLQFYPRFFRRGRGLYGVVIRVNKTPPPPPPPSSSMRSGTSSVLNHLTKNMKIPAPHTNALTHTLYLWGWKQRLKLINHNKHVWRIDLPVYSNANSAYSLCIVLAFIPNLITTFYGFWFWFCSAISFT